MFLRYLEPIFRPYRAVRNAIMRVRTTKGNFQAEVSRVKGFKNVAASKANQARAQVQKAQGQAQKAQGQAQKAQGQAQKIQGQAGQMQARAGQMQGPPMQGQMPPGSAPPGQPPGAPMGLNPNPPIKTVGFFRRRKVCTQCQSELDKTWDSCPYCAQNAQAQQPAPGGAPKTQAFMVDAGGGTRQLLGWLIPIEGPQRGELYTLAPKSVVGTEPTCHVVLSDTYMSSQHAELVAEGGVWILRDLGSTNGTYVNDQRITQRELVDNDFVRFGQSMVKFKSL
ncbi:FHA domain-containing protein [Haliangium ochraceum]|uniref:FHA domain containing protein n=1 Tax=Haliangium ochraceum (strain DSM 14365 / JCM 11303 / SMP-2) TaxID=502025 RepID=D0LX71_HALO1|nr:FHA domain-containing protein [Haliangium ochraceum]ACY16113.1 FHA domain containing protein [Haliangium ochraceum DSM 14365]